MKGPLLLTKWSAKPILLGMFLLCYMSDICRRHMDDDIMISAYKSTRKEMVRVLSFTLNLF